MNLIGINKKTFEEIYKKHYISMCLFSASIVKNKESAEIVVNDVFYKIWKNKEKLNINTSIKSYLFRAVRNTSINFLKSNKNFENIEDSIWLNDNILNNDKDPLISKEIEKEILEVIEKLPEKRKIVFKLNRIEGYKNKEIAKKMNISEKTVKNQLTEALKFLRENLKKYL